MKLKIIAIVMILVGCKSSQFRPEFIQAEILGTWVQGHSDDMKSFLFVRADTFSKFTKGFTFYADGSVNMYLPWGCQTPPFFRVRPGEWKVNKRGEIVIQDRMIPSDPIHLEVLSLTPTEFRYIPDQIL